MEKREGLTCCDVKQAKKRRPARLALLLIPALLAACGSQPSVHLPPAGQIARVERYIERTWTSLSRSHRDLSTAAKGLKVPHAPGTRWPVYVVEDDLERARIEISSALTPAEMATLDIRPLPPSPDSIREHGLIYLPRPYVVPGGRFNEMYGWDSYFIELGLLRDGEIDLAKDMADNFVYEILYYGKILNANRTYYLSRSQPPFLTQMLLGVYRKTHDRQWLERALPALENYYRFWTTQPHLTPETGLSRYYDLG